MPGYFATRIFKIKDFLGFKEASMSNEARDNGDSEEKSTPKTSETSASQTEVDLSELVDAETKKNKKKVVCNRCDSIILLANSATHRKYDPAIDMPLMHLSKREIASFSRVKDI